MANGCFLFSNVGAYYTKHPHEERLGPIFIRTFLDIHHVCRQDPNNKELYEIVADCGKSKDIADAVVAHLLSTKR
jgi:hypothetical protein